MSENAIDRENISKPAPDRARPKGPRKAQEADAPRRRRAGLRRRPRSPRGTAPTIRPRLIERDPYAKS
jgi:hypothetical protein